MVNTRKQKDNAAAEATSPTDNKSSSTDTVDTDHQESNGGDRADAATATAANADTTNTKTAAVDADTTASPLPTRTSGDGDDNGDDSASNDRTKDHEDQTAGTPTVAGNGAATDDNGDGSASNDCTKDHEDQTAGTPTVAGNGAATDDNGDGSASNDCTKDHEDQTTGTPTVAGNGTAIGVLFNPPPSKPPSPDPSSPDNGSRYTPSDIEGNDAGVGDDNHSASTHSSDDLELPGSTVNCDSRDSVSYLASPAKQSELTNVFDDYLVYSSVVMDPSMTGCTIPRDGESGILYTIGTNHNPLKHTTSAELMDRMLGKPTNATIETHLHGNIVNDAFQSFVFCGPKECLKQDAPKRSELNVNYTMMTRLGPNYGQESKSNIGIDLYKHVEFTEHIKKTTEMLETSNLRTKDSRMKVARHYNIAEAWEKKESEFSDNESDICKIINAFNSMRWEQGYDFLHEEVQYNVYFDIMEGRHRWVASICTNESSRYDQDCPKIDYGSLNDRYIKESLIQNNASKPFATNEWKEVILNSKFIAKEEACKQVKNGTYGMKSQIKFSVHTIHLKSAPEDEKVRKKEGSQEKLLYYLNDISAQSRLSKGHVSKPSTLEGLQVTLEELNIEMKRKGISRRVFSADPNRVKIGTTLQELFKPIIVDQTPVNSTLLKLKKNYTNSKEEETIADYHKISPDGFLDDIQEIKRYIEQPNTSTFTQLQDKFTTFVETGEDDIDELFKDYSESIRNDRFDQKQYFRNRYDITKEPRFKGNDRINSKKSTMKPPFVLTYHNLLQNKKKPKNRGEPVVLSLSTMNHLLVIPLLHKCCRETNYHSANLKPDQLTKQLRYIVKYHTSFVQANNALEMNPTAQIIYGFDKGTMVKEIDSVTACTLTLSHAVNAELMNNIDVTRLINQIAKSKLNQNIGNALTDTQVQYSIGVIGIMSNVLGNMLSTLIVQGIKNATKTSVSGIFPQLLRTLICSQAIYDGMDVFGNVGCNPTLDTEVVKDFFPQFLTVWNAFYSGTTVDNKEINKAYDILSKICPVGNEYRASNPMLNNGQEVATHLTTKTALKSNKYLIAWVTFIIYYHERVTASENVIHDEEILMGGRVGCQNTQRTVISTMKTDSERFEGSVMNGFKSIGDFDNLRFEMGARPKNLRQFALSSKTNWLNLSEWMALLFKPINDNCSKEFKEARESALTKLHNEAEPIIELDLRTKYASKGEKPKTTPTTKAKKKKQSPNPQSQTSNNNNDRASQSQTPNNNTDETVSSVTTKSANAVLQQHFEQENEDEYEEELTTNHQAGDDKKEGQPLTSDKPTDEREKGNNTEKGAPISTGNKNSNKSGEADPASTGRNSSNTEERASNGCNIRDNKKRNTDQLSRGENEGAPKKKKQAIAGSDNNTVKEIVSNKALGDSNNKRDGAQGETDIGSNKRQKVDDSNDHHLDIQAESTTRYRVRYKPYLNENNIIHHKFVQLISSGDDESYEWLTNEKYKDISTSNEINKHKEELLEEYDIKEGDLPDFGVASLTITNETDISFYNHCLEQRRVTERDYWTLFGGVYKGRSNMLPQPSSKWESLKSSLEINYYRIKFAVLLDIMKTRGYRYISEKIEGDDAAETKCLRFLYIANHPINDHKDEDENESDSYDSADWSESDDDSDSDSEEEERDKSYETEGEDYNNSESEEEGDKSYETEGEDYNKSESEDEASSDDDSDCDSKEKDEKNGEQNNSETDYGDSEEEDEEQDKQVVTKRMTRKKTKTKMKETEKETIEHEGQDVNGKDSTDKERD